MSAIVVLPEGGFRVHDTDDVALSVGVMLDDVNWQLRDQGHVVVVQQLQRPDFSYLLRAASSGQAHILGTEEFPIPQSRAYQALLDAHRHVLPRTGPQWMAACVEIAFGEADADMVEEMVGMLNQLESLVFRSGRLTLFPVLLAEQVPEKYKDTQNKGPADLWAWDVVAPSWLVFVAKRSPRWDLWCLDYDLTLAAEKYVCRAAYVMLVHVAEDGVPYVFAVWHDQREAYALPGGRVEYVSDESVGHTARREWAEEVNPTDSEPFRLENAARVGEHVIATKCYLDEDQTSEGFPGQVPRRPNRSRPCKAFVLMRAKPEFFKRTKHADELDLPGEYCLGCKCDALHGRPPCTCGPPRDPATRQLQYTERIPYIECTGFAWLRWDWGGGSARDRIASRDSWSFECDKTVPAAIVRGAPQMREVQQFLGCEIRSAAASGERLPLMLKPRTKPR